MVTSLEPLYTSNLPRKGTTREGTKQLGAQKQEPPAKDLQPTALEGATDKDKKGRARLGAPPKKRGAHSPPSHATGEAKATAKAHPPTPPLEARTRENPLTRERGKQSSTERPAALKREHAPNPQKKGRQRQGPRPLPTTQTPATATSRPVDPEGPRRDKAQKRVCRADPR